MPQDYAKVIASLKEHQVEFVIVGGIAAVALGAPIVTRDLDVCYRRSRENVKRLAEALAPFHPRLRGAPEGLPFRADAETIYQGCNFTFVTDAGDLDILGHVAGPGDYETIARNAERLTIGGRKVQVMSLEDLIKAKKAAGRVKDKAQLTTLEATLALRRKSKRKRG